MKKLVYLLSVFLVVTCSLSFALPINEPPNLGLHKIALERYHNSGQYNNDIANTIRKAKYYLRFRINQNTRLKNPRKLAIVLDIDETALSNYVDLWRLHFGGTTEEMKLAVDDAHDLPISPTLTLFNYTKTNHVAIFFITGRKEYERTSTIKNLNQAGYQDWNGLLMEPNNYNKNSVIPFKLACRKKIEEMGYDIVLDIGDQYSDLKGGYADMTIKLPNPYYYIA